MIECGTVRDGRMGIVSRLRQFNRQINDLPPLPYGVLMACIWIAVWVMMGLFYGESFVGALGRGLVGGVVFGTVTGLGQR
ncbi:hypothetical protein GCM10008985_33200 [Halococcus dombrowskii]|uniref:Uncharacterized protein n=1 Tax=Halococcus dombrowskii TaxID=179637 RepID=A0AAV3SKV6_HALDO